MASRFLLCTLGGLAFAGMASATLAEPSGFTVKKSAEGILVLEAGNKVLFYQQQPKSLEGRFTRANYVHPLFGLNGETLTEDFPADHRHHRGIFWAWHQLWLGDQQLGDAWSTQNFLAKVRELTISRKTDKLCALRADVDWTSSKLTDEQGQPVPIVKEETTVTAHAREEHWRLVDFEIRLLALKPEVKLGGSEDQKGYGGFSVRIELTPDTRFRGTEGPVEPQTNAVKAGPWMDVSTKQRGVAILDHPANPSHPQPWILRRRNSMQNPAYPGREPVALSEEKPLVLRYRLVVHDGSLEAENLDQLQREWAKTSATE